jgi:hypothetical protein
MKNTLGICVYSKDDNFPILLFLSFRYFGDDKESKDTDEKAKLAALLSKIEERKKQRVAIRKSEVNSEPSETKVNISKDTVMSIKSNEREEDSENKKRHKNMYSANGKTTGENEAVHVSQKESTIKKKKRKKKLEEMDDSEEGEDNTGGNVETKTLEKVEGFTVIGTDKFKKLQKVCLYEINFENHDKKYWFPYQDN